ncbi:YdhK family protein [Ureibacillus acetophenoni]|uniref:Uncharacterized protein DUF1541 n=1 Tax=Ureibacillus acetophenoni TaxID=614649 RepID=A0A285UCI8_9BACL|nr:YdhK family protein [Ureibacillus acetophenoni]SOC39625.1 uncharacterized protein DUF1541 [Ureibacillus acetophenoni]
MEKRLGLIVMSLFLFTILTACGNDDTNNSDTEHESHVESRNEVTKDNVQTEEANNNVTNAPTPSEIPEGMKEAENPKFKVGDEVIVNAEHEEGMKGAVGTVTGAFDTIVYSISYTPTHGDFREENHKWVVQEELQGLDEEMLVPGSEVIVETNQEEGMLGAEGEIDTAEKTVAYMVEYITADGTSLKKWFKESELSAK